MYILLGIFVVVFVLALIEAAREEARADKQAREWMQHNRMVAHARARAHKGVGTWAR